MSLVPLRLEQALELLPAADDLRPLRDALLGAVAGPLDGGPGLDPEGRRADPDALEAEIPALLEAERGRLEVVYRRSVDAMRALQAGDPAAAARALVEAGEAEEGAGHWEAAAAFYERAAEVGRRPRDRRAEGLALRRLGRVARTRGELDRALQLYQRGLEIAEAQRDRDGMVVACQGMGNVHVDQGRWAEAEEWYRRGLEILPQDPPSQPLWQLQSNLSVVARRAGRLDESERWMDAARLTVERLGDSPGRVYVLNSLGMLWLARGEPLRAEAAFREALAYAATAAERARVLVNLADALLALRRPTDAERVLRRLEELALSHRLVLSLPYAYRGLGAVARARRDEDGFLFFEQALELCRTRGLPEAEVATTQKEYAAWEAAMGRPDSAVARLREARSIFARLGAAAELEEVDRRILELDAGDPLADHHTGRDG